jgi:hypothetical protein
MKRCPYCNKVIEPKMVDLTSDGHAKTSHEVVRLIYPRGGGQIIGPAQLEDPAKVVQWLADWVTGWHEELTRLDKAEAEQ